MQAGESLSFISTPEELAVVEQQDTKEQEVVWDTFGELIEGLMYRYPRAFRSIERPEESGAVTVSEGSFSLAFADSSYLHVVAYGHSDKDGYIDLGLSIVEHDSDGHSLGGYLYEMSGEGVRYSRHTGRLADQQDESSDEPVQDTDDDTTPEHFSLLAYYERAEEAYKYLFSEDEALRKIAADALRQLEEEASLGLTERELGFGWGVPTLDDAKKLKDLADLVSPFTVPVR